MQLSFKIKHLPAIPAGFPFFSLRAQRKRTKRKGSQAAETTPFVKAWNRRGKNSLRSNSSPLPPAPDLAARLSGNGANRPRTPLSPSKKSLAGRARVSSFCWSYLVFVMHVRGMPRGPGVSFRPQGEISRLVIGIGTPFVKVRNRRGKQRVGLSNRRSLRSNSLPLPPAPDLAARLSGNGATVPEHLFPHQSSPRRGEREHLLFVVVTLFLLCMCGEYLGALVCHFDRREKSRDSSLSFGMTMPNNLRSDYSTCKHSGKIIGVRTQLDPNYHSVFNTSFHISAGNPCGLSILFFACPKKKNQKKGQPGR